MKQVLRFLALAALLAAPWGGYFNQVQAQQSLPYSYGFEDNNLATDGWTTQSIAGSTGINSSAKKTGSYGFQFYYNTNPPQYLISPELTGTENGVEVTFQYKNGSSYTETFTVGYSTTTGSVDQFTWDSPEYTAPTSWTEYQNTFPAGTKYVAIKYTADNQFKMYIDDISFMAPASCPKPTALTATLTPGSGTIATLNWTAGGTETEWTVEYSTSADFSSGVSSTTATGTPTANLTGLTPETQYYARVKAVCGVGDESTWSNACSFTPSNAFTLTVNDGTTTNGYVPVYGYYVDGSIVSQFIIPAASLSSIQWATLNQMTFYATQSSIDWGSALFEVYVTEVDYTTFTGTTLVDWTTMTKVMNAGSLSVSGNQMVVSFDTPYQYTGGNLMIGVKQTVSGSYGSASFYGVSATGASLGGNNTGSQQNFLPKVTFSYIPGVAPSCTKPTGLAAGSVTATGATLSWTAGGTETQWTVEYGTASDFTGAASQNASTTPTLTLTGLTPATTYYVRVKAVCSGSDESDWTTASFTTECAAIAAVGYTQNFDGISIASAYTPTSRTLPICWSSINTCTYNDYKYYPTIYYYSYRNYSNSTPNCLRFYSYYSSYSDYDPQPQYAILPEMTDLSGKQVTLWAKGYNASSTFKIGTMSDPADASTFSPITEQALTTSYQEFEYIIPNNTDHYLAIMIDAATSSRTTNGVYIDDISIANPPTCAKPTSLTKSNVAAHQVDLSWTKGDAETDWDICINDNEGALVSIDESDATVTGSSVSYTLTGLNPETAYTVKVRANCGGSNGVSQWSNEVSFTTTVACPAPTSPSVLNSSITAHTATLKWIGNATSSNYEVKYRTAAGVDLNTSVLDEDFTGLTTGIPTGWDNSEGTTTTSSYKWNYYYNSGHDAAPCVRFDSYNNSNGNTNFLKTPAMDFPAGKTMQLTFWWKNESDGDLSVYISTDGGTTKTLLKGGMTEQSSWKQESIALTDYRGASNVTIHFKGTSDYSYYYIYLDDIVIGEEIPAGEWQTVAPANITVTPGTYVGAASLSGLLAETKYEAYVRTDCNAAGDGYSTTQLDFTPFTTDIACKKPTTLAADATGATTVTLSWTNGEEGQNAWQICINGDEEHLVAANANPFTVEGLTPATTYSFKVRANCTAASDGYSDWSNLLENVETQAACPTPVLAANGITNITDNSATVTWTGFAENQDFTVSYRIAAYFDAIFSDGFENGIGDWTLRNCHSSSGITTNSSYVYRGSNALCFRYNSAPPQYIISPELSSVTTGMRLSFYYKNASNSWAETFQIGFSSTDVETASFVFGEEITASDGEWHLYNELIPAGTKYICWKYTSNNMFYLCIDDVAVGEDVDADTWQTVSPNPTTTTTTITGLSPETKYDVKVQANCALSQTSGESEVRSFTTFYGATLDVTANSWYAIASPVHNSGKNETVVGVDNLIAADPVKYDFLRYNEQYAKWESQKDDGFDAMERGRGHIYRRSAATTLKFIGERNTGNITYYCQGASSGTMKGWNLIGNPYPHEITRAHISQANDYLVSGYYTLQTNGIWRAEASTTAPIAVGQAILVKVTNGGNVTFRETAPATKAAPASTIAFTVSNDEFTDIAYARFSSEEGLPKIGHLNPEAPMLSIDGYAIANLNEGIESFPMSFSGQGSYTLTVSGNTDVTGYLHLVDRLTGRDIDLLSTPSYSFTGSPVSDRFTVKLTPDANEGNSTSRFAIFDGNSLIVNGEGTLEVYDVMGRRLMSAEVTGSEYRISGSDLHTGVYVLRMNGNSQKIVIK